jgi:agmatine deiminase
MKNEESPMTNTRDHEDRRTPAELGFAMPAEWERHAATWLAWPHCRTDWPGKLEAVAWAYGEMVRRIAPGEKVRILVQSAAMEARARAVLAGVRADLGQVEFFRWPTNRSWSRDFGPICVRRGGKGAEVAIAKFAFTAWGGKYPNWRQDNRIPYRVAEEFGLRLFEAKFAGRPFVLEGGAIDVNGRSTLLTTEECLLDAKVQVRNPGVARRDVEAVIRANLGVTNVLWLGDGIAGDDTHGHVDDLCRFVSPDTVVLIQEKNPKDANYRPLRQNRERLTGFRLENGAKLNVIELPCPQPLWFGHQRLPASYANFYIANSAVIVPTFNDPADRTALGILADVFPGRPVVGIHAVDLVRGFGTLHCLTQQQPAGKR